MAVADFCIAIGDPYPVRRARDLPGRATQKAVPPSLLYREQMTKVLGTT